MKRPYLPVRRTSCNHAIRDRKPPKRSGRLGEHRRSSMQPCTLATPAGAPGRSGGRPRLLPLTSHIHTRRQFSMAGAPARHPATVQCRAPLPASRHGSARAGPDRIGAYARSLALLCSRTCARAPALSPAACRPPGASPAHACPGRWG